MVELAPTKITPRCRETSPASQVELSLGLRKKTDSRERPAPNNRKAAANRYAMTLAARANLPSWKALQCQAKARHRSSNSQAMVAAEWPFPLEGVPHTWRHSGSITCMQGVSVVTEARACNCRKHNGQSPGSGPGEKLFKRPVPKTPRTMPGSHYRCALSRITTPRKDACSSSRAQGKRREASRNQIRGRRSGTAGDQYPRRSAGRCNRHPFNTSLAAAGLFCARSTCEAAMKTQQQLEQAIHEAIDEKDEHTLQAYAQHVACDVDSDIIEALCFGLLMPEKRGETSNLMAIIMDRAPDLALGLIKLDQFIDRQRADFMVCEAERALNENQVAQERAA